METNGQTCSETEKEEIMLTDKKLQYAMWLGTPRQARIPYYAGELATTLEVTPQTLSNWTKDPEVKQFAQDYKSNYIQYKIQPHLEAITEEAIRKAKTGSAADRRLVYELAGILGKSKVGGDEPLGKIDITVRAESSKPQS